MAGACLGAVALAYVAVPPFRQTLDEAIILLARAEPVLVRDYIRSFGWWAPPMAFGLMILQTLIFPLPDLVVVLANGLAFGTAWGALLSWGSELISAAMAFGIARSFGRPIVHRVVGHAAMASLDTFFRRHGARSILVTRAVPLISTDLISYSAGALGVRFRSFLAASAMGFVPAMVGYAYLGEWMARGGKAVVWGVSALLLVLLLAILFKPSLLIGTVSSSREDPPRDSLRGPPPRADSA